MENLIIMKDISPSSGKYFSLKKKAMSKSSKRRGKIIVEKVKTTGGGFDGCVGGNYAKKSKLEWDGRKETKRQDKKKEY